MHNRRNGMDCWLRRDVEHVVYRCWSVDRRLLYVGATNSLVQRKSHHRKRTSWWGQVAAITTEPHPNRDAALAAERTAIRNEEPLHNRERY
jgi:predicted GIY-YIG superfamily endonuclease